MITEEPVVEDDGRVTCHECEEPFERPGYHWSNGSCDYPAIPEDKDFLVRGLMLGDGTLRTHTSSPFVQTYMINKPFLEWVDNELAWLSTGVSLYRTGERSAEISRNNGHPDADDADYHDVYVMQTRTMSQFEEYVSWYAGSDRKQFTNVELTPAVAKVWYACDGSLNWDRRYPDSRPHVTIGVKDEYGAMDTVQDMFYDSTFMHQPSVGTNSIRFGVEESAELLDWMGAAPPGFEYKWATDSIASYENQKEQVLIDSESS